jgi:hypothetical protein
MKVHDDKSYSILTMHSKNASGVVVSTDVVSILSLQDTVPVFSTSQGDKKNPNNHKYSAYRELTYRGKELVFNKLNATQYYNRQENYGVFGNKLGSRLNLPSEKDAIYNRALAKLYEKVRGGLDLSVAVAESHETARMLNILERFRKWAEGAPPKEVNFNWRQPLNRLGNRWLEWHLAVRPLLQDLYGSVDEFYRHKLPRLMQVQAKVTVPMPKHVAVAKEYANDPVSYAEVDGFEGIMFSLQFQDSGGFDLKRWSSLNPVSIAWELMPLSFVVDYFYNISQMLRSLETSLLYNSSFVRGYWTWLYFYKASHRDVGVRKAGGDPYYVIDKTASSDVTHFERNVLLNMPLPKPPVFKLPTSWQQLVTMASLLAVKLKK